MSDRVDRMERDDDDRWRWDLVSWCFIALIAAFVAFVTLTSLSHTSSQDFREHFLIHTLPKP